MTDEPTYEKLVIENENLKKQLLEKIDIENSIKDKELKYQLFFDNTADAIFIHDTFGNILDVNHSASIEYGYSYNEFISMNASQIDTPEQSKYIQERISELIKNGYVAFETLHQRKNKSQFHSEVKARKIIFNGNASILSICRNITERKQIELIVNQQNVELKKHNADKDRFISVLAHDLKSPFSALLGFSDLLLENLHKYDMQKIEFQIKAINQTVHNTYDLLEQILLWAKTQSGKLTLKMQKFNFAEITNEIINIFENQANEKQIKITCFETEKTILNADLNMYKTILRNLISNAIKFTNQNGQINIYAEKKHINTIITVSDNGIGIDKSVIPKLWKLTEHYSTTGTNNEKGTGFGLIISKELIEKQGGQIWVESEVRKGSNFKFTLPLCND